MLQSEPGYLFLMRPEDVIAFCCHAQTMPSTRNFADEFFGGEAENGLRPGGGSKSRGGLAYFTGGRLRGGDNCFAGLTEALHSLLRFLDCALSTSFHRD